MRFFFGKYDTNQALVVLKSKFNLTLTLAGLVSAGAIISFVYLSSRNAGNDIETGAVVPATIQRNKRSADPATRKIRAQVIGLNDIFSKWDTLGASSRNVANLREAKVELIRLAEAKLNDVDLGAFLARIVNDGEYEIYRTEITLAVFSLFFKAQSDEAFIRAAAFVSDVESKRNQRLLCYPIGTKYCGLRPGLIMDVIPDRDAKQEFLTGYCCTLAGVSPESAFRAYQNNLPEGGDYSGLKVVASNIRSDFQKFLSLLPDDNRSTVLDVRTAAIKSWTRQNPIEALEYVRSNQNQHSSSDLTTVVSTWMEGNPNEAIAWANEQSSPVWREAALVGIIDVWKGTEPQKAWDLLVSDGIVGTRKDELLKRIHAEWIKADPNAAEAARIRYQASQNGR